MLQRVRRVLAGLASLSQTDTPSFVESIQYVLYSAEANSCVHRNLVWPHHWRKGQREREQHGWEHVTVT
jgi:hypothetical protein